jgi:hypothetical protein
LITVNSAAINTECTCLFGKLISFPLAINPIVGLLGHMIVLCHCHYSPGDICFMEWNVWTQWMFLQHQILFFLIFKLEVGHSAIWGASQCPCPVIPTVCVFTVTLSTLPEDFHSDSSIISLVHFLLSFLGEI